MRTVPMLAPTPIIMTSATSSSVALTDASGSLEVSAFLRKPVQRPTLLECIVDTIGKETGANPTPEPV
jgi:hypothetical protein